jgi:hypothetical protein
MAGLSSTHARHAVAGAGHRQIKWRSIACSRSAVRSFDCATYRPSGSHRCVHLFQGIVAAGPVPTVPVAVPPPGFFAGRRVGLVGPPDAAVETSPPPDTTVADCPRPSSSQPVTIPIPSFGPPLQYPSAPCSPLPRPRSSPGPPIIPFQIVPGRFDTLLPCLICCHAPELAATRVASSLAADLGRRTGADCDGSTVWCHWDPSARWRA